MTHRQRDGEAERPNLAVVGRPRQPSLGGAAIVLAALAAAIGASVALGWCFDVTGLTQLIPGAAAMTFSTAVSLLVLGVSWMTGRWVGGAAAVLVAVLAATTLAEYVTNHGLGVDVVVSARADGMAHPGRMAIETAAGLLLIAAARVAGLAGRHGPAEAAGLVVLAGSTVALFGYLYRVHDLYSLGMPNQIAPHTAAALLLLSVAVLASVPDGVLTWSVLGSGTGPSLLRRLLPLAFGGLPMVGVLALVGQRAGWYRTEVALAVVVVGSTLLVGAFAWSAAHQLSAVDRRRVQAVEDLRLLADELEDRVQQRVAQIEAHHARIAVLEDRERIATELHDVVVQKLFAAGMQLQGVAELADRASATRRIDAAVDAIDGAIDDLRASISRLEGSPQELDPHAAAREDLVDVLRRALSSLPA